jgi:Flp pilus assembly protein TadD
MALAAVVLALAVGPARTQPWYGPGHCGPGFAGGFAYRSGFAVAGPGLWAGWFTRGFYAAPIVPYPSIGWFPAYGPGYGPGYGNPFFLPPPGGAYPLIGSYPPVVVVPPPVVVIGGNALPEANVAPAGGVPPPAPRAGPPAPPLAARPGDFIVISPRKDWQASGSVATAPTRPSMTPAIDRVAPPPTTVPARGPAFDRFVQPPVFTNTDRPEADPAAEIARQVRLGRDAFATGEYGLAAEHFERAIRLRPDDPLPYFLRAQAHFAAGKYTNAVADIRDGMAKSPDWPAAKFDAKELYGANPERFDAHLAALRKAADANPADPALLFLLGHELWFAGDRPAALKALRDAARLAPGNAMIERFLREVR